MTWRTRSTRISAPPPGSESWPASRSRCHRLVQGDPRDVRDVEDLRRRQRVEVDRVARLDVGEEVLVPLDPQVRVVAALQQQRRAAEVERLLDLAEDHRLRQHVALRVHRAAVERAEVAVGDAEVGVVDVPVDQNVTDVRVGRAVAHACAASPTLTRSREASSASASSSPRRPPARTPSRISSTRVGARVLTSPILRRQPGHDVELAVLGGEGQERLQPGTLGGAELVAQPPQVGPDEVGREREAPARRPGRRPRGRRGSRRGRR